MKFITTLLAASSVLASSIAERDSSPEVSDFRASVSNSSAATMHFVVTDQNYPNDTPTDCNLIWTYGGKPKIDSLCNNGQYYIRFPGGSLDLHKFILELERVSGPTHESGFVTVSSDTEWTCAEQPEDGIKLDCSYDGVLTVPV